MKRLLLTLPIALALASCGPRISPADKAASEGIFLVGNGSEPQSLDPQVSTGFPASQIQAAICEGLINFHLTDDTEPEPGVAESWSDENSTTWTFNLRKNAKWSNGDPVTAHDFIYSFQRILSKEFASEYAEMLYQFVEGAKDFFDQKTTDFADVGIRAIDDYTLRIELVGPIPHFLNILKHHAWYPVHPPTIEKFGGMLAKDTPWTLPENTVTNGAFKLKSWRVNDHIEVERNPHYWDAAKVGLNGVKFFPIEHETTEDRAYRDGQLHKTNQAPLAQVPTYKSDRDDFRIDDAYIVYFYRINTTRPPLDDPRIRRALALAIDRQSIVDNILRADQKPTTALSPPDKKYTPPNLVTFDVEKAKTLLAEAGFPDGKDFPEFEILINTMESHRTVAEVIQEMWKKNLNINVSIRNEEWKVFLDTTQNMNYDISRAGWVADYPNPSTFLQMWIKDGGNNETGWANPEFESLLSQSMAPTQEAHYKALFEAETILLNEMPIIPIYWYTRFYLIDQNFEGWNPKMLDQRPWKYMRFKDTPTAAE